MIDVVGSVEAVGSTQSGSMLSPVMETMRNHELRLQSTIKSGLTPSQSNQDFKRFLEQTFARLQTKFSTPIEQQTFNLLREQALASRAANVEHIRDRVESKLGNIHLEMSMKAASKVGQGVQQLLSSQ